MRERLVGPSVLPLDESQERITSELRPRFLADLIGQHQVKERLSVAITAANQRQEAMEHTLLYGPPGLGKTTLAYIIAAELGQPITITSGPALSKKADLFGLLTQLKARQVLFIDEIHRLPTEVEELLYPAMEDFAIDFIVDAGAHAQSTTFRLKPFTLIGATTRAGLLKNPLRDRFGIQQHLEFYPVEDLEMIISRSAGILGAPVNGQASRLIASRSRGTPRIANRLLRRVRDFAQVRGEGEVTVPLTEQALILEGIDKEGLDALDRRFLSTIAVHYDGGPVGIQALAATLNEELDTLTELVEPFLLKEGFLARTSQGRMATRKAFKHLGLKWTGRAEVAQSALFEDYLEGG
ncbi:MAG TPA: Holliday junction branch migration DNA helicase RuvB [bacterium]|nr:Holliday junction branch migration DNA helicase RuvB [bacterium]